VLHCALTLSSPGPLRLRLSGACVYTLSLPVMLLLGEGSAAAGLVSGVQEALARTSSTQHLVIYTPRLEVSAAAATTTARVA
jgi:hypothetical protein